MARRWIPQHPAYDAATWIAPYRSVVENLYVEMDAVVGERSPRLRPGRSPRHHVGPRVRVVAPGVQPEHLAARQRLSDAPAASAPGRAATFDDIDWSRTRAYGLGLNGLYINVRGRESSGIVDPGERDALVREIGDEAGAARSIPPPERRRSRARSVARTSTG